ncbi:hypothetical protein GGI25_005927 [Coemansia spiralis]|uniref:Sepiapterin reductase n=1 Tax=Coemansia spiralis TaxID=417178 RepID=A0A9W8G205_9FUNG|nr:hypothetical protein BX070DRAFT_224597 [Coemansia spiralis]KAJ2619167.1 hypothetical protein GGI26_006041 [Coemansia sp. RSA 1358]KAJ2670207.1 hypothetical protein GGI25_005927 [Coemansia spiralis]
MSLAANHIFVVTGAGRGLGCSIAKVAASRAEKENEIRHLILVGRNRQALETVGAEIVSTQTRTYIIADVELSQPAQQITRRIMPKIKEVVAELEDSAPIRLTLVQCAGTIGDLSKTVDQYDEEEIEAYVSLNYVSFSALAAKFLAYAKTIQSAERITIVNISSLLAIAPFANWGLYASIKAARDQLLKVVAIEYAEDLRVKTLNYAPGPLDNDMQADVRASIGDEEQKKIYTQLHHEKKLVNETFTAGLLCDQLDAWDFESGAHIDIYDIVSPP